MIDTILVVTALVLLLSLLLWYWLTSCYGKYEAQGLFSVKPKLFFGNCKDLFLQKSNMMDFYRKLYWQYEGHKYGIVYEGRETCFLARHPDIVKRVLITDFDHFTDLRFFPESLATMAVNDLGLQTLTGEKWRSMRSAILPAFSLRNLKNITPTFDQVALEALEQQALDAASQGKDINVEQLVGGYSMDCITRTAFSISVDASRNPENDFSRATNSMVEPWRFSLAAFVPWTMKLLNISMFRHKSIDFLTCFAKRITAEREKEEEKDRGKRRDDVIALLMRLREGNNGTDNNDDVKDENAYFSPKNVRGTMKVTSEVIAKTILQFFMDGYDTVTTNITLCVYFLAADREVQRKAAEEVDRLTRKMNGEGRRTLQGEDVNELHYLDQIISECGRMGSFPYTGRICTKPWNVPGTKVVIPKGMRVIIPMYGLHTDPKFFPEPDKFCPERFDSDRKSEIPTGAYLPFGIGPRQCMGIKMARQEGKVFLYRLLRRFRVELAERTRVPPIVWRKDHFNRIEGGYWVRFVKRE